MPNDTWHGGPALHEELAVVEEGEVRVVRRRRPMQHGVLAELRREEQAEAPIFGVDLSTGQRIHRCRSKPLYAACHATRGILHATCRIGCHARRRRQSSTRRRGRWRRRARSPPRRRAAAAAACSRCACECTPTRGWHARHKERARMRAGGRAGDVSVLGATIALQNDQCRVGSGRRRERTSQAAGVSPVPVQSVGCERK